MVFISNFVVESPAAIESMGKSMPPSSMLSMVALIPAERGMQRQPQRRVVWDLNRPVPLPCDILRGFESGHNEHNRQKQIQSSHERC